MRMRPKAGAAIVSAVVLALLVGSNVPAAEPPAATAAKTKKKCKKGFVKKKVKGKKKCVKKKTTPAPVTSAPAPAPTPAPAPVEYNSCANPYWTHTMRCQVFPAQEPQPNLDSAPATTAEIKDFTRVFLDADPTVRSVDGTIPIIYVDKAVCPLPGGCGAIPQGEPIESDKWVISMTGGGSCTPPGVIDGGGGSCFDLYEYTDPVLGNAERGEMSTATDPPMKDIGADELNPNTQGINSADPTDNPVFAGYNRVRVEKSTYDRYIGRATYEAAGGAYHDTFTVGGPADYNLYFHGFLQMEGTLEALQDGLTYDSWRDNAGTVEEFEESLPPLADAEQILFVGHSGAAHGLYTNIDHLHQEVDDMAGGDVDVRAVFDANFIPSPENEALFNTPPTGADLYDNDYTGSTSGDGQMFSYDGGIYLDGHIADMHNAWSVVPDASCVTSHPAVANDWQCNDRMHVLFNHVSTPFFIREDFIDTNPEHTNGGTGHSIQWGPEALYPHCMGIPCWPRFTVAELRQRHLRQISTLIEKSSDLTDGSEIAKGTDSSFTPGTPGDFPSFYVWMPSCGSHEGAYKDGSFNETRINYSDPPGSMYSMREWMEMFAAETTLADLRPFRIHDYPALPMGTAMTSDCPGP